MKINEMNRHLLGALLIALVNVAYVIVSLQFAGGRLVWIVLFGVILMFRELNLWLRLRSEKT